jgi:hypothetical protein
VSLTRLRRALPVVVWALVIGGLGTAFYLWGPPGQARAEARAYVRCVERRLKQFKAMSPAQLQILRANITHPPFTLRVKAEERCSVSGLRDNMFWNEVRTTPSGELVPCTHAHVRCPYEEEGRSARQVANSLTSLKEVKVKAIMRCTQANIHCSYEEEPTLKRCRTSFLAGVHDALVPFRPNRREWQQWVQRAKSECRKSLRGNARE